MKLIILLFCVLSLSVKSQNITDSILDGSTLLNLKQAKAGYFYRYIIDDNCSTLIKYKFGLIEEYKFIYPIVTNLNIDTIYHKDKNGLTIILSDNEKKRMFNELHIYNRKDDLYLMIVGRDTLHNNFTHSNMYFYYSNKQLCSVIKNNASKDTINTIKYTRDGKLSSVIIEDSSKIHKTAIIYTKKGAVDFKLRSNLGITVREQYDGKGNLLQVDSTNAEYKHIGTRVSYYLNKNIKEKIGYSDGKQDGIFYIYYENGVLKATETYKFGRRSGKYIYFNKDGTIKKEGIYK